MPDEQTRTAANPLFRILVQAAALAAAGVWGYTVIAFGLSWYEGRHAPSDNWRVLVLLLRLGWMTPVFLLFVVPALFFSFGKNPAGAKIAALLLGGAASIAILIQIVFVGR